MQSSVFSQSGRLSKFLSFAIDSVLKNQSESLKEYVIGTEVYDRRPPYDPKQDSIVRSEARRLRSKLKQYYESEGSSDPVFIYFRPGSYVPVFRRQITPSRAVSIDLPPDGKISADGRGESFAVIPFRDLSETQTATDCAAALTDELNHQLARSETVRVASTWSAKVFESYYSDLPMLAQKLSVSSFVHGSVRQEARRLKITVQCLKADGFQVWSQHFETEPEPGEVFAVCGQIARSMRDRFRPKSSFIRKLRASAGSVLMDIVPALYRSESVIDEGSSSDIEMQVAKLEQLALRAPGLPDPICDIAECWYELALRGTKVSAKAISEARSKAVEASELDPEMAQPVGCTAALFGLEWNWKAAEETFQRALRMDPQAATFRQYAMLLAAEERFEEARYSLMRAHDLDPFSQRQRTAWARLFNLSRAGAELDHHFSQQGLYGPLPLETKLYLALGYCALGRRHEAMKIVEENRKYAGGQPPIAALLAEISARCGETASAQELTSRLNLFSPSSGLSRFRQGLLATALNDTAAAFAFLTSAVDERDPECIWMSVEPRLDSLRHNPGLADRFAELAVRVTSNI